MKAFELLGLFGIVSLGASYGQGFVPGCKLPFDAIKSVGLAIDAQCGIDGNAGDNTAKRLESNAKNNFCAPGNPVTITPGIFTKLQSAADKVDGLRDSLKTSRSALHDLVKVPNGPMVGEGAVVKFVAFVRDAHFSNEKRKSPPRKSGELVNCNEPGGEFNDIHIELVNDANEDDTCTSVTAEMSPHFRPEAWTELTELAIPRPVRVTGHLFFDGSHQPCRPGKRASPARISVWEIHPVYGFDICTSKSISACRKNTNNDAFWVPLDRWHSHEEDEEEDN